jgi:cytochrome P450
MRGNTLSFLTGLVQRYGDISSFSLFGRQYVVVSSPELAKEVLLTQADAFWKGPGLQNSKGLFGEGLLTAEGEVHKCQRRVMQPAFHAKRVEAYAGDVVESTLAVCEAWSAQIHAQQNTIGHSTSSTDIVVDLRAAMMRLTLVIAGRALFGAMLEEEVEVVGRSMEVLVGSFSRTVVPWGKMLNLLPLPSTLRIKRARESLMALVDRMIAARRTVRAATPGSAEVKADLLSAMLAATDPESNAGAARLTDQQLRDQSVTILTAGHETTANAMTFTLRFLAQYPEEQRLLREEVERVLGGREPVAEDMANLERTRWVLAESMRLLPPAWALGRENQREVELAGYRIPKKTTVLIPQWTLHRDERFFAEPLAFRPERWKTPQHPRYAYLPFSTGPRNCIGESFAWLEMMLALAMLVDRFTFALDEGSGELEVVTGITLRPAQKVSVRVKTVGGHGSGAGSPVPAEKTVCPFNHQT